MSELKPIKYPEPQLPAQGGGKTHLRYAYMEPVQEPEEDEVGSPGLAEYWRLVQNRWMLIAGCALAGALAGLVYCVLTTPLYLTKATIEVQGTQNPGGVGGPNVQAGVTMDTFLDTQLTVLKSRSLRERVIKRLQPDLSNGKYVTPERYSRFAAKLGALLPHSNEPVTLPPKCTPARTGFSQVVEIACVSPSPELAVEYANAMTEEFIGATVEGVWNSAQRTGEWLAKQLDKTRNGLAESEKALRAYSQQAGLVYTGNQQSIEEERLKQLQEELTRATSERVAKQSAYETLMLDVTNEPLLASDGERLGQQRSRLAELRASLADQLILYTPSHYSVVRIKAQIEEIEKTLQGERDRIRERITGEYKAAAKRESLLMSEYSTQLRRVTSSSERSIYYGILARDAETNRRLYEQLLERVSEVRINAALPNSYIRVLDEAAMPIEPFEPSLPRRVLQGLMAGLLCAMGFVVVSAFTTRKLREPGDSFFHLRLPELAVIPSSQSLERKSPILSVTRLLGSGPSARDGEPTEDGQDTGIWSDSRSLLVESYRNAVASLLVGDHRSERPHAILVTSTEHGDGKSTVISNIAIGLAETSQRVVVIDADMRKPSLHDIFNIPNAWGLSDILQESKPLDQCPIAGFVKPTEYDGLYLLPAGPGAISIATLLYSARMAELMGILRKEFDMVLVDTPPMSNLFDARALGRLVDGAILVIRSAQTSRSSAQLAKRRLVEDGIPVLGTILNNWDMRKRSRYGYYSDHYGSY